MNTLTPWLPDADWDSFMVDRTFTGRRQEMDLLRQELLTPEPKAVAIVGSAGMGKTTLAMMFGQLNRDFFSAGVYHVHATPVESLVRTVDAHVSNPSKPYLLVLDEVDTRPAYELRSEIQDLRRARPSARLICISRPQFLAAQLDLTIQLGGLNQAEFFELLAKAGPAAENAGSNKELFEALSGNVLATRLISDLLQTGRISPREVLQRLRGFSQSGIVDASGNPIVAGGHADRQIIVDVTSVSDQLLERVHANPTLMYELSPRRFEEFVAEVLNRLGYSVTLTPASGDGGKDIYAAKKDHLGSFLYVVECKKYAPDNPVGVGLIRQLNGVVQAEQATAGILATTSFFTKGAKEFQRRISHQMGLKDFLGIQEWLQEVFRR
ncbi:MAG: restriction endonuclease [Gammaproteobacteria bacterium]